MGTIDPRIYIVAAMTIALHRPPRTKIATALTTTPTTITTAAGTNTLPAITTVGAWVTLEPKKKVSGMARI